MKNTIIAMVAALSLMLPTQASAEKVDPLVVFLFGAIIGHTINNNQNQQRPKHRPRRQQQHVVTYCNDRTWIPKQTVYVQRHWEDGYRVEGHYKTRKGYWQNNKYRC